MWWIPLAMAAVGAWSGQQDKKARNSANKANQVRYDQALSMFGWLDQPTYSDQVVNRSEMSEAMREKYTVLYNSATGVRSYKNKETGQVISAEQFSGLVDTEVSKAQAEAAAQGGVGQHPTLFGRQQELFDEAETAMRNSLGAVKGGFEKAERLATTIGQQLSQRALDREQQQLQSVVAQMTNSGLGGSSVAANLDRGVRADTERSLQEIGQNTAQARSGLAAAAGAGVGSAYAGLAQFLAGRSQAETGLGQSLVNIITGRNDVVGPSILASMGGAEGLSKIASAFGTNWGSGMGSTGNQTASYTPYQSSVTYRQDDDWSQKGYLDAWKNYGT